jgi:hypothetical protein
MILPSRNPCYHLKEDKLFVLEIFLKDTKVKYRKMLSTQEVNAHTQDVLKIIADPFRQGKGCRPEGCREHQGCHCAG